MTNEQWELLLGIIDGATPPSAAVGFISDSPWLPGWAGMSLLDYFTNERMWARGEPQAGDHVPGRPVPAGFLGGVRHVHRAVGVRGPLHLAGARVSLRREAALQSR